MKHGDSKDLTKISSRNVIAKILHQRGLKPVTRQLPLPFVQAQDKVVMFDAVCKLCTGWTRFLIQHDKKGIFKLCSVQSPQGQAILTALNMPTDRFETMLLIEGHQVYERSDAVLRIMQQLPFPLRFVSMGQLVPRVWRDWAYDEVASRRYQLFGKHAQCVIPSAEIRSRFIDQADL